MSKIHKYCPPQLKEKSPPAHPLHQYSTPDGKCGPPGRVSRRAHMGDHTSPGVESSCDGIVRKHSQDHLRVPARRTKAPITRKWMLDRPRITHRKTQVSGSRLKIKMNRPPPLPPIAVHITLYHHRSAHPGRSPPPRFRTPPYSNHHHHHATPPHRRSCRTNCASRDRRTSACRSRGSTSWRCR